MITQRYRVFFVFLAMLAGVFACEASEAVKIENAKLHIIQATKFTRISEYFTGHENQGHRVIVRSNPDYRGGLYFIIRFSESTRDFPKGLHLSMDYYSAKQGKLNHQEFALPYPMKRTNKIFAGITAEEIDEMVLPIAWRIQLIREDGSVYSELKSYLWEMPETL